MKSLALRARLATALRIVATLGAIALLLRVDIGYDAKLAPFVIAGRVGETVTARAFAIEVESVEFSHAIAAISGPRELAVRPLTTAGIWVVVHAKLDARNDPLTLVSAFLRSADGYDYEALGSRAQASFRPAYGERLLNMKTTSPGLPGDGVLIFELPPTRVADAHLRVSQAGAGADLDNVVDVDLGLDKASAAALLTHASAQFVVRGDDL